MTDLTGVPALTLKSPWAHLVAHHGKRVENRTWAPPDDLTRFLVHAGKGWDGNVDLRAYGVRDLDGVTASAVIAVADLAHVCVASRTAKTLACDCGVWAAPSRCHWSLGDVRVLPEPVPCAGRQGLWRPDAGIIAAVAAQLKEGVPA